MQVFNTVVLIPKCKYFIRYRPIDLWREISGYEYDYAMRCMIFFPYLWEGTSLAARLEGIPTTE